METILDLGLIARICLLLFGSFAWTEGMPKNLCPSLESLFRVESQGVPIHDISNSFSRRGGLSYFLQHDLTTSLSTELKTPVPLLFSEAITQFV